MSWLTRIVDFFRQCDHAWSRPAHKGNQLVQVCFECGTERVIKADLEYFVRVKMK
jgi:hypothetical protein